MDVTGKSPLPNGGHGVEVNGNGNTIGGTTPGARNLISGNALDGVFLNGVNGNTVTSASGNSIQGNYIGTDSTGAVVDPDGTPSSGDELGNGISGIEASLAPNNLIGGIAAGAGNIIAGNGQSGISVPGDEVGETIQGNFIGTNPAGAKLGNHFLGITIGTNCIVGGTVAGAGNVIGNNSFVGINIGGPGNIVQGNFVGTNSAGAVLPNTSDGISISSSGNTIGGATAGAGNVIANNRRNGITVFTNVGPATQNAILGNSISANLFLGIDLASAVVNGVTPNDSEDPDTGANNLQNFPEVSGVTVDGTTVRGQYVVPSTAANSAYPLRIEFFKADAGGQQGQTFLGFDTYTAADANASKTFAFTSGAAVAVAQKLVATATDNDGNTSEFSANVTLQASACSTVVINTNDTGTGSLRSAITCANDTAGIDIVSFNIPGSGVQTISPVTVLPTITDPVIIDGYTQPGASANMNGLGLGDNAVLMIELNGANSGFVNGLNISSGGSTIEGLVINRFVVGILLFGSGDNVIEGNFLGTDATGTVGLGGGTVAIVGGANNTVGGATPKSRNVISANSYGIEIHSTGNVIQGNFIGTDVTGSVDLGSSNDGVLLDGSGNMIGGTAPGTRNIISGNDRWGIDVVGPGNLVQGNFIGTDVTGTLPLGNGTPGNPAAGIVLDSMLNTIGGTAAGQGNIIAFNAVNGVYVASGTGNSILSNSIFANTGLGIDLGPAAGVTANDPGDADTGPNNLQNFPVLFGAVASGNSTIVSGRLNSLPSTFFRIEFFANDDADSTGYGEGQTFLGAVNRITDASCIATFGPISFPVPAGQGVITATATRLDASLNPVETSEFSDFFARISGTVLYCSNPVPEPVPNVTLTLTGNGSTSTLSDSSGNYQLSPLTTGESYTVTPAKAALLPGTAGINTIDVVAVQRHYLGIEHLPAGCRLTAANVNGDTVVDTVDVIAIQRFFLGRTTGTANVGKYQFIPASRTYPTVVNNQTGQNYDALVFGDVASGFVERPEGPSQSALEAPATVAAVALPEVTIDAFATSFIAQVTTTAIDADEELVGFQGDLTFDERAISFQDEPVQKAGVTSGNWNVSGNVLPGKGPIRTLRISAFSNDFTPLSGSGTLFELKMTQVSKTQDSKLAWAPAPNQFIFVDADLNTRKPGYTASGSVASAAKRQ
jgi:hypothetical protein